MSDTLEGLVTRLRATEEELEMAFERKRSEFAYTLKHRKVIIEDELTKRHRAFKIGLMTYVKGARLSVVITAPIIYSLIIPFVLLDFFVTIYQAICFPIYGVPKIKRTDYIALDRHKLAYLNALEKLNCSYCAYGNGLIAYVREIAARTEQYWCPIKHARRIEGAHTRYAKFPDFGDAETYRQSVGRNPEE